MVQEKNIRDDTSIKTDSPDILLLANKKTKSIRVASDEAGKTDRFDKLNHENPPFLVIDKYSILENFLSNYFRQSKDPTEFRLFRAPLLDVKEAAPCMRDLFKENPSKECQDFAKKYEVKQISKNESINPLNKKEMNTIQEPKTQTQTEPAVNPSDRRFNEARIDWENISKLGISRDILERKGLLNEMLEGRKTSKLLPVKFNLGFAVINMDARLSFRQTAEGTLQLSVHGVHKQPKFDYPYYGHVFSEEDKKNLMETNNMGRLAKLSFRGSEEKVPCFISLDPLTNEIVAARADRIKIPEELFGQKLTVDEQNELSVGRKIYVESMISPKTGKEFDAHVQVNAEKWGIQLYFEKSLVKSMGGVDFTPQQTKDYNSGITIFVENMQRRNGGEPFSSFITKDANGNPLFTRYNPQSPEGNREIYIPKVINGVELTQQEHKALHRGVEIYLDNMVNDRGEVFSKFVKVDTESGRIYYSDKANGFNEIPEIKVPTHIMGKELTGTERAQLQEKGKIIEITDMTGFNGEKFSSLVQWNSRMGHFEFPKVKNDNPEQSTKQTEISTTAQTSRQSSESRQNSERQEVKKHDRNGFSAKIKV